MNESKTASEVQVERMKLFCPNCSQLAKHSDTGQTEQITCSQCGTSLSEQVFGYFPSCSCNAGLTSRNLEKLKQEKWSPSG